MTTAHHDSGPDEAGGLVLDSATHRYTFDGQPIAGVSEILQGVGIVDARWFKEWHAQRGTAVHAAMQLLVLGTLDWSSLDERIVGYVSAGQKFCQDAGVVIGSPDTLTEHLIFSRAFRYAGRVDLVTPLFTKMPAVVDWKSGDKGFANLQTAAYADPLQEELGLKRPLKRIAVQLSSDGSYRMSEYRDSRDFSHFAAAALIYNHYHLGKRKDDSREG